MLCGSACHFFSANLNHTWGDFGNLSNHLPFFPPVVLSFVCVPSSIQISNDRNCGKFSYHHTTNSNNIRLDRLQYSPIRRLPLIYHTPSALSRRRNSVWSKLVGLAGLATGRTKNDILAFPRKIPRMRFWDLKKCFSMPILNAATKQSTNMT